MRTSMRGLIFLLSWLVAVAAAHAASISLSIADIAADAFAVRGVRLSIPQGSGATLLLDEFRIQDKVWRHVGLQCGEFELDGNTVACRHGRLVGNSALLVAFTLDVARKHVVLSLQEGTESWQLTGEFGTPNWSFELQLQNAQANRLAGWMPADWPQPNQGRLNGRILVGGDVTGLRTLDVDAQLSQWAFSDSSGLHAAEGVGGTLRGLASRKAGGWDWQGEVNWQRGELFWQPLYLSGGYRLQAAGTVHGDRVEITQATASLAEVGEFKLAGSWDIKAKSMESGDLQGLRIALAPLFSTWIKPLLPTGALTSAELSGHADLDWHYRAGNTERFHLNLYDAGIADAEHRYGLRGINAAIPWQANAETQAKLSWASGEVLKLPLGATELSATLRGLELTLPVATVPILDGKLSLRDFHLHHQNEAWHWSFAGSLAPISMQALSSALGLPEMYGTLSGMIPQVSYADGEMTVDGALLFRLFDGTIVANRLRLYDAFGRAPRLSGNLDMRGLDLDLLTRTFSFGNVQGKLDVSVNNLELANWQPVRFDAKVASSPGRYRKKISQKAVENISSLGGSGATAALQRSFLRVFENFGYEQIGLSCVLRDGVCLMDGVSGSKEGYVIVQGGGIPAITVMGYNRAVGWDELLARLKRVLQDNVKAVVK